MNTIRYMDYVGSVEKSEADGCLYGKVLGMPSGTLLLYEGNTLEELEKDFRDAVEFYIADCKERGFEPCKSFTGNLTAHVSPDIQMQIAELAREKGQSIDTVVENTLRAGLAAV